MSSTTKYADSYQRGLGSLLFRPPSLELQKEFDAYVLDKRVDERVEIDVTRRYTSTWSTDAQQQLFKFEPGTWFHGLPEIAQEFLLAKIEHVFFREFQHADHRVDAEGRTSFKTKSVDPRLQYIDAFQLIQVMGGLPVCVDVPEKGRHGGARTL